MHKPISLQNISLSYSNKYFFEDFSTQIYSNSRIAIIGRNGSGKSSLLNILNQKIKPANGNINIPDGIQIGQVEQIINNYDNLSGGQRLNKRLSEELAKFPDLLLLDEPTNHLDQDNKSSLIQMLKRYQGSLIIVSHDTELLRHCVDTIWHIDNNKIHEFTGSYDDYLHEFKTKRASLSNELNLLKRNKKDTHNALMKEQKRAAKSKAKGKKSIDQKKWPTIISKSKALIAEQTSAKKKLAIDKKKQQLTDQLSELRLSEIISAKFSLTADNICTKNLLCISNANLGYSLNNIILRDVYFSLNGNERVAICGKNASGKSSLLKAILSDKEIYTTGNWHLPAASHIGYLDQHYSNLKPKLSVIDHLKNSKNNWTDKEIRCHLNDFLFRKNDEVMQIAANLSGGEKARLSLSLIAAATPKLLILDEITNNLDLETKEHVIQVLNEYAGAIIAVSHDEDFLKSIKIDHVYKINNRTLNS